MRISCFPWYDLPELRQAHDLLWSVLADHLNRQGMQNVPDRLSQDLSVPGFLTNPNLLIGQCCGYDVIYGFSECLKIVGTPCYSAPNCENGNYTSCLLVRENDAHRRDLEELRGAVCVINGFNSHSGTNALRALVAPMSRDGHFFSAVKVSGAHQTRLALLHSDQADVMAIDGILYELLRRHRPDALQGVRVLCWTASAPAPPFVTSATTDHGDVEKLRAALRDTLCDEASLAARSALLLTDVESSRLEDYGRIIEFEAVALRNNYSELHPSSPIATITRS